MQQFPGSVHLAEQSKQVTEPNLSATAAKAAQEEAGFWNTVKGSVLEGEIDRYLARYPKGRFIKEATARKAELHRQEEKRIRELQEAVELRRQKAAKLAAENDQRRKRGELPIFLSAPAAEVQDAFFDYGKADIREDARTVLTRNAATILNILPDFPNGFIVIEGHTDGRGAAAEGLVIGERRALAAKEFLVQLGVPATRLKTVSYGNNMPQCTESAENCWQRNRRVHFTGQ